MKIKLAMMTQPIEMMLGFKGFNFDKCLGIFTVNFYRMEPANLIIIQDHYSFDAVNCIFAAVVKIRLFGMKHFTSQDFLSEFF